MSQFRNLFVEFSGDPSNDKELYKRYCSSEKFEPLSLSDEVIHFVEIAALEAAQREMQQEIDDLKKSYNELKKQLSVDYQYQEIERLKYENEVYVSLTEPRIENLTSALKVAEDALEISKCKTWHRFNSQGNWTLDIHDDKECVKCKALDKIQIIKKGLG